MRYIISLFVVSTAFWLLNSGHYEALMLSFGLLSIGLAVFVAWRMDLVDGESQPVRIMAFLPLYWLWLIKEIVLANLDVVYRIWAGNSTISPRWIAVKASQATDLGKVIYANSITLTPGTLSVDLEDDEITVHALTEKAVQGVESGEMDRRICRLDV